MVASQLYQNPSGQIYFGNRDQTYAYTPLDIGSGIAHSVLTNQFNTPLPSSHGTFKFQVGRGKLGTSTETMAGEDQDTPLDMVAQYIPPGSSPFVGSNGMYITHAANLPDLQPEQVHSLLNYHNANNVNRGAPWWQGALGAAGVLGAGALGALSGPAAAGTAATSEPATSPALPMLADIGTGDVLSDASNFIGPVTSTPGAAPMDFSSVFADPSLLVNAPAGANLPFWNMAPAMAPGSLLTNAGQGFAAASSGWPSWLSNIGQGAGSVLSRALLGSGGGGGGGGGLLQGLGGIAGTAGVLSLLQSLGIGRSAQRQEATSSASQTASAFAQFPEMQSILANLGAQHIGTGSALLANQVGAPINFSQLGASGFFPQQEAAVNQLGQQMFSRASGNMAQRGFLRPENAPAVAGSALTSMLPALMPLISQNIQNAAMTPENIMMGRLGAFANYGQAFPSFLGQTQRMASSGTGNFPSFLTSLGMRSGHNLSFGQGVF